MGRGLLVGLLRVSVLVGDHRYPSHSLWPVITSFRILSTWPKARSACRCWRWTSGMGTWQVPPFGGEAHAPAVSVRDQVPVASHPLL